MDGFAKEKFLKTIKPNCYLMEINAIYEGDNIEILNKFPNNSVDLIYADPPFFSNRHYEVILEDGAEKRAFQDRWQGGIEHYITWMEPRLRECYRVLKETGTTYLHCDIHANAHLRILMDKIFGENNFRNEIIWCYRGAGYPKKDFGRRHDTILRYSKTAKYTFNLDDVREEYAETTKERFKHYIGNVRKSGDFGLQKLNPLGKQPDDWWEIQPIAPSAKERLGYPTQKPLVLLEKIIKASSNKGDIVLDPFCGCGTTLVASHKFGRRWIGIDVSPTACKLMMKRLRHELSVNAQLIKGNVDLNYVKKLPPFEFQNWVVVDKFLGNISRTKSGDFGIDGLTPQITGGFPIQVKQSEDIGRNVIDNFQSAMRRFNKKKGYIVAYSFGKGAREEVATLKNKEGIHIILRTVQELIDGKVEE